MKTEPESIRTQYLIVNLIFLYRQNNMFCLIG